VVNADGRVDAVGGGVDDADGVTAAVDGVNLVPDGICGQAGGVVADLEDTVLTEIDEVQDGDRVCRRGYIGELAVGCGIAGEGDAVAASKGERQGERAGGEGFAEAGRIEHCCEV